MAAATPTSSNGRCGRWCCRSTGNDDCTPNINDTPYPATFGLFAPLDPGDPSALGQLPLWFFTRQGYNTVTNTRNTRATTALAEGMAYAVLAKAPSNDAEAEPKGRAPDLSATCAQCTARPSGDMSSPCRGMPRLSMSCT